MDAQNMKGATCGCQNTNINAMRQKTDSVDSDFTIIELDVYEASSPRVIRLSTPLDPQKSKTTRIFLCPIPESAKYVLAELGDDSMIKYINQTLEDGGTRAQKSHAIDGEPLIHYDPASLFTRLSIQVGEHSNFQIPECVLKDEGLDWVVNNQLRLSAESEDRFTVVWFDFRSQRDIDSGMPSSELRKAFQQYMMSGNAFSSMKTSCSQDFLACLLLDIVNVDLMLFRRICFSFIPNPSIQDLRPRYTGSYSRAVLSPLKRRLRSYYIAKAVTRKTEDLKAFIGIMSEDSIVRSAVLAVGDLKMSRKLRELESISIHFANRMARWERSPEDVFRLHSEVFQVRQASSLSSLTVLASIFLPLSLAAGILSMQYRFNELHLRIYDFFGVTVMLCTLAIVAYLTSRWISNHLLREWYVRSGLWESQEDTNEVRVNRWVKWMLGLGWCLGLASFLVGMFLDYRTGLTMMAAALSVALFLPVVLLGTQVGLSLVQFIKDYNEKRRKRRQAPNRITV